jgi:predicted nuclease of predicted toxin-antitoxin system
MAKPVPLLADLNISPLTVEALAQEGWDVIRVSSRLPSRAPDPTILEFARKEGRAVVTQDLDFSALVALSGLDRPSLVTLRLSDSAPETVTSRLLETSPLWEEVLAEGVAVTIDDDSVRVRRLPIRR